MQTPILIYGCQRTATNLAMRLLADGADCYQANGEHDGRGWKHDDIAADLARLPIDGAEARVLLCVRHPLRWMPSCYDYFCAHKGADRTICRTFRRGWTFEQFCRSRHYRWQHPAERWNDYYARNSATIGELLAGGYPAALVRSESLETPAGQLAECLRLVEELRLDLIATPHAIGQRVDNRGRLEKRPWNVREYTRRVQQHWTPALRDWVTSQVDWTLAAEFSYTGER